MTRLRGFKLLLLRQLYYFSDVDHLIVLNPRASSINPYFNVAEIFQRTLIQRVCDEDEDFFSLSFYDLLPPEALSPFLLVRLDRNNHAYLVCVEIFQQQAPLSLLVSNDFLLVYPAE